jgi:hypothetical protein
MKLGEGTIERDAQLLIPYLMSGLGLGVGARVYNSGAITLTTATTTLLTFDTERFDTSSIHSTSSNTGRLTAPRAGKYIIVANVRFAPNATGARRVEFRLNAAGSGAGGTRIGMVIQQAVTVASLVTIVNLTSVYQFASGDYVEVFAHQDSGGNLDVAVLNNESPEFMMMRLG